MSSSDPNKQRRLTDVGVQEDLQRQPHLFFRLAENALTVAESLRGNYFKNTATFILALRKAIDEAAQGRRTEPILNVHEVADTTWAAVQNEVVTFIDGGVGQVQLASRVPILLRVGSYRVRTGERRLSEREQFGYYPVILGDLEGGSKERRDFVDIVRITAELLGGLSALERTPDLRVLMFHGPLVYTVWHYMGHMPFTEQDIDLFLSNYANSPEHGQQLKEEFLQQAYLDIYPGMTDRSDEWCQRRLFEPLAFMAFLYHRLIAEAKRRSPPPMLVGVVERGSLGEFSETVLLKRVFRNLRKNKKDNYFNDMYGRTDLTSSKALLARLNYTDALLMAMILQPGQFSESWEINKYEGFRKEEVMLPGLSGVDIVRFGALKPGPYGFPRVRGCYLHVSETTEPVRIEVFDELADEQLTEVVRRVFLYSRLLPGYGFPVGLDIADKYAHVPNWLTDAYGKLIRYHLGVSLQQGEISDVEMRRILVQAIYMTHRDWLFRPDV
jgi:NurA domain